MTDEGFFAWTSRLLRDKGMNALGRAGTKAARVVIDSGFQIIHELGGDPFESALFSGIAKLERSRASGLSEGAAAPHLREAGRDEIVAAMLRDNTLNRAYFIEECDRRIAEAGLAEVVNASPGTPEPQTKPLIQREKNIELQKLLKAAGYGGMLTRHGEGNGGVDGVMGRDTIAAVDQFRRDHHLAANADIMGDKSIHIEPTAPVTPSGHVTAKTSREV